MDWSCRGLWGKANDSEALRETRARLEADGGGYFSKREASRALSLTRAYETAKRYDDKDGAKACEERMREVASRDDGRRKRKGAERLAGGLIREVRNERNGRTVRIYHESER